jgi:hypothetical protein
LAGKLNEVMEIGGITFNGEDSERKDLEKFRNEN